MPTVKIPKVKTVTVTAATSDAAWVEDRNGQSTILLASEAPQNRKLRVGDKIIVTEYQEDGETMISSTWPEIPVALLEGLVPELREGTIRVMGVARAPGVRTKIAVATTDLEIDPRAACVGKSASRVKAVSDALGGERMEIVLWKEDPLEYAKSALEPSIVTGLRYGVEEDGQGKKAIIADVPDHRKSSAIGDGGLNARLASELVDHRIHIDVE